MRGTVAKRLRCEAGKLAVLHQESGALVAIIRLVKKTKEAEVFSATAYHTGYRRIYQDLKRHYKGLGPGPVPAKTARPVIEAGRFASHLMRKLKTDELLAAAADLIPSKREKQSAVRCFFAQGLKALKRFVSRFTIRQTPRKTLT